MGILLNYTLSIKALNQWSPNPFDNTILATKEFEDAPPKYVYFFITYTHVPL